MQTSEGLFEGQEQAAERLLREAIRQDPDFATAHRLLSVAVRLDGERSGQPRLAEALRHIERAVAAGATVGDVERLVNEGELYAVRGGLAASAAERTRLRERAAASFEATLQLRTDNPEALICLTNVNVMLGRPNAAMSRRLAELRPNSLLFQRRAALDTLRTEPRNRDLALQYVRRAQAIVPVTRSTGYAAAWALLFDVNEAWVRDRPQEALRHADRVAAAIHEMTREAAGPIVNDLASVYLTLGQFERATQVAADAESTAQRRFLLSRITAARGDRAALRAFVLREYPKPRDGTNNLSLFIEAGLCARAAEGFSILKQQVPPGSSYLPLVEGQLALADGRPDDAIRLLQPSQSDELLHQTEAPGQMMRGAMMLADAWVSKRNTREAIAVLENASRQRGGVAPLPVTWGWTWLPVRDRLAVLYRDAGRPGEAETIDSELRELLAVADADHPVLKRLRTR